MGAITIDDTRLKDIFKKAIVEILQERKELVSEIIEEAFEEEAMVHAIKKGQKSKDVSRSQIMEVLEVKR